MATMDYENIHLLLDFSDPPTLSLPPSSPLPPPIDESELIDWDLLHRPLPPLQPSLFYLAASPPLQLQLPLSSLFCQAAPPLPLSSLFHYHQAVPMSQPPSLFDQIDAPPPSLLPLSSPYLQVARPVGSPLQYRVVQLPLHLSSFDQQSVVRQAAATLSSSSMPFPQTGIYQVAMAPPPSVSQQAAATFKVDTFRPVFSILPSPSISIPDSLMQSARTGGGGIEQELGRKQRGGPPTSIDTLETRAPRPAAPTPTMPELPEVEASRRALAEHCVGKKIVGCSVADDNKVIEGVSPSDLEAALIGKTIVAAHRKGKNLWLRLDSPPFPTFQFGMAGAIYIKGVATTKYKRAAVSDADEWPSKYFKVLIKLNDGLEFSFTDKRRFARVRLLEDPESVPPISVLGPDALFEPMKNDEFVDLLSKKKIGIKALLLDQSFISGIGNWIADEVLYQARVHPLQVASSLSKESMKALHSSIKEVIEKAIDVGADSSQYPTDWIFHSREKKPGKAFVDGKKIEFLSAGGRTSAYVPELQIFTGNQEIKAPQRKSKKRADHHSDKAEASVEEEGSQEDDTKSKKPKKATSSTKKRQKKN